MIHLWIMIIQLLQIFAEADAIIKDISDHQAAIVAIQTDLKAIEEDLSIRNQSEL